MELVVIRK